MNPRSRFTHHVSSFTFRPPSPEIAPGSGAAIVLHRPVASAGALPSAAPHRATPANRPTAVPAQVASGRNARPCARTHARARAKRTSDKIRYSNCVILREAHMRRPSSFQFDGNLNGDCPRFESPLSELTDVIQPPVSSAATRCEGKFNQTSPMRTAKLRAGVQITSSHIFTGSAN